MKHDAPHHWKLQALGHRIGQRLAEGNLGGAGITRELSHRMAVGIMECLWNWARRYCPRGDIGRVPDEQIAAEAGWPVHEAAWFVDTLVELRLLDRHDGCRLVIHHFSQHAEDYVRKSLERAGIKRFADGTLVRRPTTGRPPKSRASSAQERQPGAETRAKSRKTHSGSSRPKSTNSPESGGPSDDESPENPPAIGTSEPAGNSGGNSTLLPRNSPETRLPRTDRNSRQTGQCLEQTGQCREVPRGALPGTAVAGSSGDVPSLKTLRLQRAGRGSRADVRLGSAAAAVARPEYPTVVAALRQYWPAPDPLPERLAQHPNATVERVMWLVEQAESKPMRNGARGKGGFVRSGIENAYEVPAEWVEQQRERLQWFASAGATA